MNSLNTYHVKFFKYLNKPFYLFPSFKVTKKVFLISKKIKNFSTFHIINKFAIVEEIFPSLFEITSIIREINCKSFFIKKKSFLGVISTNDKGVFSTRNIKLPKFARIINKDLKIFHILSENLKFKVLLKFEV